MSRARQRSLFATPGDGSAETGAGVKMVMPNRAERDALFRRIDYNGNGMLSLAEIDKAVLELWPQFDHKRALMRAYQAADRNGDGMIRRREFRLLLKYIIYFDQMWEHFEEIDSNHDHRLSPAEFAAGCATMGIQLTRANAAAEFAMMDENGGGFILFDEFCHWCARRQVPVEGEALTSDESELLGGAVKGGAGPPLPERERTAFMGQPVSLRSSRRSGGKRALRSGPMVCYLHRNGEIVVPGEGAMLKTNPAQVPDFAKFLDDVTVKLGLMSYCKKLFRPDGTEVTSLEEIRPKEDYVASWTTEFLPPSLVPKHKSTRWNHSSPGRGAQRASPIRSSGSGSGNGSSSRGAASPARQRETRSPRRSYVRSPGRGAASAASIERTGSAGRSRPATAAAAAMAAAAAAAAVGTPQQAGAGANLSLADKRRILLEHRERSGGKRSGSPRRTVGGGGGGGGGGGSPGRSSSPAQLQSEVRRLQKDLEREIAEQRALEKRLRQLDEAEARASRDAEKQAMRLAQEEERRLAAEERQLAAAEARLAKEREDWERDRTPPPRMRAEVGERSPVASSSSGMGLGGRMGAQTARWDAPPSQQEEHAAAAKLQANYRGYATRRDMKELETIRAQRQALEDQAARQQAEREAAEQQTRMQQAELERSAAAQAALAPAPIVALALSPAASTAATTSAAAGSPGKLSAIERARQRREMKASRAEAASLQRSGQQPQQKQPEQKPRELHYATSLNTPSKRVTVAEFGAGLASGAISAASVVVWTKGMDSWKLPQAALDTFPELAPALQAAAGGGAGNGDGGDGGGATAAGQPSMAEKRRMVLEARQQQLKEELQGMKVMALFKKAHAEGVLSEEQLEEALEGENPKQQLIELMCAV